MSLENKNTDMQINHQQGAALLMVLLLVVFISVLATTMLANQRLGIRKSSLLLNQTQLNEQLNAGENYAIELMKSDAQLNQSDSYQDIWANTIPPFTDNNFNISLQINDMSGRFNINNLYQNGKVSEYDLETFKKLLASLGLESKIAVELIDWQDADNAVYKDGGDEATVYGLKAGEQIYNQPFISLEQLTQLSSIDDATLKELKPYIFVAPIVTKINVNTAHPTVVAAVLDHGELRLSDSLGDLRFQPVANKDQLWQSGAFNGLANDKLNVIKKHVDVSSQFFEMLIIATDKDNKSKYETVNIIKMNNESGQEQAAVANPDTEKDNIKLTNQRIWSFLPSFETQKMN